MPDREMLNNENNAPYKQVAKYWYGSLNEFTRLAFLLVCVVSVRTLRILGG